MIHRPWKQVDYLVPCCLTPVYGKLVVVINHLTKGPLMNNELISETGAYYVDTRYTPVTNRRGSGIALRMAGDSTIFDWVAFDYEIGGGLEQHRSAVSRSCSGLVQFAYETKRGYVFAVTPGKVS